MSYKIVTTDGKLVVDKIEGKELTEEQAERSAAERNERAEELGIKTRYEAQSA